MIYPLDRLALVSAACLAICCGPAVAAPQGQTLGFVVKTFTDALHDAPDNCPDGLVVPPKPDVVDVEDYLKSIPSADAARIKAFPRELHNLIGRRGPNRTDVCENPTSVPDPGMRTVQGKVAEGFDLDGTADGHSTPNSCAHQKFVSPAGEPGVDNQLFRVQGCANIFYNRAGYINGWTLLIEVTGVDDPKNDDDVRVGFYLGVDRAVKSAAGNDFLPDATFQIDDNPKFQTVVRGKIVNGVLTTEPADIPYVTSYLGRYNVLYKGARLRLELLPDGNAKGELGGYVDWRNIFVPNTRAEAVYKFDCDAYYYALQRLADGYPDPKTGQCTAISSAYKIEAVRAFLYREVKNASAGK